MRKRKAEDEQAAIEEPRATLARDDARQGGAVIPDPPAAGLRLAAEAWVAQQGDRLPLRHGGSGFLHWTRMGGQTAPRTGDAWLALFRQYMSEPTRR